MFPVNSQNHPDSSLRDWTHSIQDGFQQENCEPQMQWVKAALQHVNDAVILIDELDAIILLNPMAEKITGWRSCEAKSLLISEVFLLTPQLNRDTLYKKFETSFYPQDTTPNNQYGLLRNRDNANSWPVEYSVTSIHDQNGQNTGKAIVFHEMDKSCHLDLHSSWQVNHDFLTGLINRPYFERCLTQAVSDASESGINHALCYLDFDHFKILNEALDYAAGDEFLRQISLTLQSRVRKTDILARLGGDEFGLILYQCNLEQALNVLQIICAEIQAFKFVWQGNTFSFSVSAGISILSAQSISPSRMLIAAKSACEVAKSQGRSRIHVYQPDDREIAVSQEGMKWIPRLHKALEENQFCLYFQPIIPISLKSQEYPKKIQASFEILLRLQDDSGRVIAPGHFIPVAERYGLMHLLDRWVIQNLFQYLEYQNVEAMQSEQGEVADSLYMVNLSGASLNDDRFLDFVKAQFSIYSIPPQMICFEITETMAIANLSKAIHLIQQLKALGCYFALDDFGSGMSSLGYLKNLPIDYLKIDGLFIKDIAQNQVDCEIVEAIHHMAKAMGIQTIAEFVENNDILMKLKTLGINYAQGYGIARPAPLCERFKDL
jgi:diguanylate cyclase (GGDEF)-like protein/PAS domain S-box-containing protein